MLLHRLITLILITSPLASGAETLTRKVETFNRIATRGVAFTCADQPHFQPTAFELAAPSPYEAYRTTINDRNGVSRPISVIKLEALEGLYENAYPGNWNTMNAQICASRSHMIGKKLAENGIESVKLYLESWSLDPFHILKTQITHKTAKDGNGRTAKWDYHVVNMILVDTGKGEPERYVIDPYVVTKRPIPYSEWRQGLDGVGNESIISRFNHGMGDQNDNLNDYDPKRLIWAENDVRGDLRL